MSTKWQRAEPGPTCGCGAPTMVHFEDERPMLLCIFHTKAEGAMFSLPSERPERWPDLTVDELREVILRGQQEFPMEEDNDAP